MRVGLRNQFVFKLFGGGHNIRTTHSIIATWVRVPDGAS